MRLRGPSPSRVLVVQPSAANHFVRREGRRVQARWRAANMCRTPFWRLNRTVGICHQHRGDRAGAFALGESARVLGAARAGLAELEGHVFTPSRSSAPRTRSCSWWRRGAPLLLGLSDGVSFAAFDRPALLQATRRMVALEDGDGDCGEVSDALRVPDARGLRESCRCAPPSRRRRGRARLNIAGGRASLVQINSGAHRSPIASRVP